MAVKTRVNAEFLCDVVYSLRSSLNQLNQRAGLGENRIYHLVDHPETMVRVDTIDKLSNAIEEMMVEQGMNPPDDLWSMLTVQEIVLHSPASERTERV